MARGAVKGRVNMRVEVGFMGVNMKKDKVKGTSDLRAHLFLLLHKAFTEIIQQLEQFGKW